jgi:hypothetical protein
MGILGIILIIVVVALIAEAQSDEKKRKSSSTKKSTAKPLTQVEIFERKQAQKAAQQEIRAKHREELKKKIQDSATASVEATAAARAENRLVVDPDSAEKAMEIAMARYLGIKDARLTPVGPDGGIDIESKSALAQVKYFQLGAKVGRPDVQRLLGAVQQRGTASNQLLVLFFAFGSSPFTAAAIEAADTTKVALFSFNNAGEIFPANKIASELPLVDSAAQEKAHAVWKARQDLKSKNAKPRAGSTCICGGTLVVRQRRSDGRRFLGCSRYPKCGTTHAYSR